MKNCIAASMMAAMISGAAAAQEHEITVPDGWTATESGIAKGNNQLYIGPVLDLGELTQTQYLQGLAEVPVEGVDILLIGELEDGDNVIQITREIVEDGNEARSTYFICKGGRHENRLLELVTDDVFAVISGGKAAIDFCAQS